MCVLYGKTFFLLLDLNIHVFVTPPFIGGGGIFTFARINALKLIENLSCLKKFKYNFIDHVDHEI
jgi:hypothetical protein